MGLEGCLLVEKSNEYRIVLGAPTVSERRRQDDEKTCSRVQGGSLPVPKCVIFSAVEGYSCMN